MSYTNASHTLQPACKVRTKQNLDEPFPVLLLLCGITLLRYH